MSAPQTSPQTIIGSSPKGEASAASTVPSAKSAPTPIHATPGADFDLDDALRKALPDHGVVDWDDVTEKFLAAVPNRVWRKAMHRVAKEWCRRRVAISRQRRHDGKAHHSLWDDESAEQTEPELNGNGKPWFAQSAVRDSIERKLDEMWAGENGTKRLREFNAKDVANAKTRSESTVRTGLLRVKAFDALLKAMNKHKPKTVGDLPRDVLEQIIPPLFVSAPMHEDAH